MKEECLSHDERLAHDQAYKRFFSDPDMVKSLLRDFVDETFVADMDFSTLERCSSDHVTDDLRERHDDCIWRVRWKDSWAYLYLILKFQSSSDPWMAVRILCYTALLWQDLIRSGQIKANETLPPVFPLVLYNGSRPWTARQSVTELLGNLPPELTAYQPSQKYFLVDEGRVPEDRLENEGLVTYLVRLERTRDPKKNTPDCCRSLSADQGSPLCRTAPNLYGLAEQLWPEAAAGTV